MFAVEKEIKKNVFILVLRRGVVITFHILSVKNLQAGIHTAHGDRKRLGWHLESRVRMPALPGRRIVSITLQEMRVRILT